jgi:mRNA interferase MazF
LADIPGDKRRPVLLLTRNAVIGRLTKIVIAPVTTRIRGIPTEVPLGPGSGMRRDSVANLDNMTVLPVGFLVTRLGGLAPRQLERVCDAARFAIDC